jgi:uncharacterized protein
VRHLGCLQLDPISVVARSHQLVVWSRVGRYDRKLLRRLQERDRVLFEYWAHAASLVPSSDLPIHRWTMDRARAETSTLLSHRRVQEWMLTNAVNTRELLGVIGRDGPLRTQDLRDFALVPWANGGWSNEQSVSVLLEVLSHRGEVLVSRRDGSTRWWDLAERCLPADAPAEALTASEVTQQAAVRSVRALGVGTATHVNNHYTRKRYPGLAPTLAGMVADGTLVEATVDGLAGRWYLHADDRPALDETEAGRLTLLSPFDNLICDRNRTEALWDFEFRLEIYTPRAKRRWGYYVLPVLDGDRLVARIDAAVDPASNRLVAKAVHREAGVRWGKGRAAALTRRFEDLGRFVGATGIEDPTGGLAPTAAQASRTVSG